jgi:hypothetical protein
MKNANRKAVVTKLLAIAAVWAAAARGAEMNLPENIADRRQLFVDGALIERLDRVALKLHEPISGGVAIKFDKPWEGPSSMGSVVFRHDGKYLMYYNTLTREPGEKSGVICVATSADGIVWTRPAIGLVERGGRRDANIVGAESGQAFTIAATPWLDTRPETPAAERVKIIVSEPLSGKPHTSYNDPPGPKRLVFWGSAEGFIFHKLEPQPELVSRLPNCFDGGNSMFWSEAEQQYVFYYRFMDKYRTVARTTSPDLRKWSEPAPMTYGDTPREHLYVNNTQPYFRAPQVYVALAARFMETRGALTDAQAKEIGLKPDPNWPKDPNWPWHDCSDAVLLTSHPGSNRYYRTFMEGFVRPGPGAPNWVSRANFPLTGLWPCGPDRMMFWINRQNMQDSCHVERLLLRLDGFVSVNAPYTGGEFLTKPLIFEGRQLEINYRTSAAGFVRVEIQDEAGRAFSGYTLKDCGDIIGDEVARVVAWKGAPGVQRFAGKAVRLRFEMKDADLFSFKFQNDTPAPPEKPKAGSAS